MNYLSIEIIISVLSLLVVIPPISAEAYRAFENREGGIVAEEASEEKPTLTDQQVVDVNKSFMGLSSPSKIQTRYNFLNESFTADSNFSRDLLWDSAGDCLSLVEGESGNKIGLNDGCFSAVEYAKPGLRQEFWTVQADYNKDWLVKVTNSDATPFLISKEKMSKFSIESLSRGDKIEVSYNQKIGKFEFQVHESCVDNKLDLDASDDQGFELMKRLKMKMDKANHGSLER